MNYLNLSDIELYTICQELGQAALAARRKFMGTLPEVNRRALWKTKGYLSIFEFAAKLGGVSHEQVRNTLNLDKKFVAMPVLRQQLVTGKVSVNKLIRVASIATPENQIFLAEQTENLSKSALETLVRDEKILKKELPGQPALPEKDKYVKLPTELADRLEKMEQKGLNIAQILNELLDQREAEIAKGKAELAQAPAKSRHIPIKIKRLITAEHGAKCSVPICQKPSQTIHHTSRFSLTNSHDPHFLAPLCQAHHEIAHKIDRKVIALSGASSESSNAIS